MIRTSRKRRLVLFAASTAVAAGGVVVPTSAFAATPAAPHTVMADSGADGAGNKSSLLWTSPNGEGRLKIAPREGQPAKVRPGKWGDSKWGKNRPGKDGISQTKVTVHEGKPVYQCVAAPCNPPEELVTGGLAPMGTVDPSTVIRGNVPLG
ncbi:hypothetical protein ACIA98_43025 [Streptomyces sp. NPDC051366]|uniref:hypothetical protein n=1 Tax=Streptomyces sp. NPDC051366 TaxID=3365652 RepID=UPI003796411A